MFGFRKSPRQTGRNEFRAQFLKIVEFWNTGDREACADLGLTISSAYELFATINTNSDIFGQKTAEEQRKFISMLQSIGQRALDEKNDRFTYFGFALVEMWVEAVANRDYELMELFSRKLKKFTIGGPPAR